MSDGTITSVYRYYDKHKILIYVGITQQRADRNRQHNGDKDWWPYVANQEVDHYSDRQDAHAREVALIQHYRPPFNKQHNREHAVLKEAYVAFVAAGGLDIDPRKLMHERGGKIRLFGNYDYLSSRATFITRPDDWAIVRCMRHATDRHVLNQHGSRIGYIDSLRVIGAIGRVDAFNSRGTAWRGIHNCVGVVKLVAEKGAPVIEIKHIRVTEGEL